MSERLTRWEGRDEDGPRAVLAKRDHFPTDLQEALRKLARLEDEEERHAEQLREEGHQAQRHHSEEARDDHQRK